MVAKGRVFLAFLVCLVTFVAFPRADALGDAAEDSSIRAVVSDDAREVREGPNLHAAGEQSTPGDASRVVPAAPGTQEDAVAASGVDCGRSRGAGSAGSREADQPGGVSNLFDEPLNCIGTEPFWNLKVDTRIRFKRMAEPYSTLSGSEAVLSGNHTNVWSLEAWSSGGERAVLFLRETGQCSDDMSDFRYRYEVFVRIGGEAYSGCCNRLP